MLTGHDREPSAQRIGPYEALLDIGSGGMGTISLACATGQPVGVDGFARLVALKRPLGALATDREVVQRFLDEARLLAQIHHVNVVGVHQIGGDAAGHFLVLDYIEGGTLDEMISRQVLYRKKMPPPIVLRIMCDVLAGLHAVHEAADVEGRPLCMLHRDVSTHNVLVGRDGVARVADFGIAKAIISSTVTDKAYLQGRIPYMAPEYLRRDVVDRRLDVYAAGITMWTALAGRLPWADAAEAQIVKSIVFDGVPPLSTAGVTVAPAVEEIVKRACARDPAERFASAREMLETIEDVGRRTGWMGSHAEVAAFVEELLGRELRARRTAIARRLASLEAQARAASSAGQGAESGGAPPAASAPVLHLGPPSAPILEEPAPNTLPSGSGAPRGPAPGEMVTTPTGARVPFQSAPEARARFAAAAEPRAPFGSAPFGASAEPRAPFGSAPFGAAAEARVPFQSVPEARISFRSSPGVSAPDSAPQAALHGAPGIDTTAPAGVPVRARAIGVMDASAAPVDAAPVDAAPAATSHLAVSAAILPGVSRGGALGRVAASLAVVVLAAGTLAIWRWRAPQEPSQLAVPAAPSAPATVAPAASAPPALSSSTASSGPTATSEPAPSGSAAPSSAASRPPPGTATARSPRVPPHAGSVPSSLPTGISTSNPYR